MDERMDGWTDGWMDGWMGGWGRVDAWMDSSAYMAFHDSIDPPWPQAGASFVVAELWRLPDAKVHSLPMRFRQAGMLKRIGM